MPGELIHAFFPPGRSDATTIDVGSWERADRSPPPIEIDIAPVGRALGGCLMRMAMLALFTILLLVVVMFLLGGPLLGLFGLY